MKIKLLILENDNGYLSRVVTMFNNKFANELEIYSYTDKESAIQCLESKKVDFFLASDAFRNDISGLSMKCGFAYLVDSLDIDRVDQHKAICKYQKGELIYKQILSIYSEFVPNITGITNAGDGSMKTIAFCSPSGGVGNSTAAAACAIALASKGYRVLYLNMETYGDADVYFACDGQFDFSDIIYAVKSNKTNRTMKLQSTVKQDSTGVYFYSSVKVPLDMMEMTTNDYLTLQDELKSLGCYDYVVMDMQFSYTQAGFKFLEHCNSIVLVTDGSETSEKKMKKALLALQILDGHSDYAILPRMWLLKNKCGSGMALTQHDIRVLGEIPVYQNGTGGQMARQLSLSNIYDQLI